MRISNLLDPFRPRTETYTRIFHSEWAALEWYSNKCDTCDGSYYVQMPVTKTYKGAARKVTYWYCVMTMYLIP